MRLFPLFLLLATGCPADDIDTPDTDVTDTDDTGDTDDTDDTDELSELCAVERDLATEQDALGLTAPSVCGDMVDLGDTTLVEIGVVPASADFGLILNSTALPHRAEFEGDRRLFSFDGITVSVASGSNADLELAVLAAQAWTSWKTEAPASFGIITEMREAPTADTLDCCGWRNRFEHVVLSLDATPLEIGASVSVLGPVTDNVYANTALISIDRETALGTDAAIGSRPIYQATDARENQLRYFADGAVFTLAHEATHLYIDQRNSVSSAANRIWDGRNYVNASYVSAEEVVSNFTACEALSGKLTAEMDAFNLQVTGILRGYDGVDERLDDLRLYSVVGAERLKLSAGAACGG